MKIYLSLTTNVVGGFAFWVSSPSYYVGDNCDHIPLILTVYIHIPAPARLCEESGGHPWPCP